MTAVRSLIHPCVICIMILLNTDGKVGIRLRDFATSSSGLEVWRPPRDRNAWDDLPGYTGRDQSWLRGGRTTRMAALTTPVEARSVSAIGLGSSRLGDSGDGGRR